MYSRDIVGTVITSVIMIAVFTFISVQAWAEQRRREREAFYRSEVLKKLAESTGEQVQQVREILREQERNEERKSREGGRLAGVIVTASGLGMIGMFAVLVPGGVWSIGLIPTLIGVALLIYNYGLTPRTAKGNQP
ncbi:MAG TPA: DUF6249 domain-containing protein [Thermoanaerobaculia bacterium]|jgi:Flp pilus assembly protein TadB|nr:DUF6249 domain-containing protein [Thermoanaerobaculia bacterium]